MGVEFLNAEDEAHYHREQKRRDEEERISRERNPDAFKPPGASFFARLMAAPFVGFALWIALNLVAMCLVVILTLVTPLTNGGVEESAGDIILIVNGVLAGIGAIIAVLRAS